MTHYAIYQRSCPHSIRLVCSTVACDLQPDTCLEYAVAFIVILLRTLSTGLMIYLKLYASAEEG